MIETVLNWLPERFIRRLYNTSRNILHPTPSPVAICGNDPVAQACRFMLQYGGVDEECDEDHSETKLRVIFVADNQIVDEYEMLLFAGYVAKCVPGQPLFASSILSKLRELIGNAESVLELVRSKPAGETWLLNADGPTVLDFYAAAVLYETDESVAECFVDELMTFSGVLCYEEQSEEELE